MSGKVLFDPTSDKWALSDGEHYLEVPHWAREIIADEFERETRRLKDKLQRRTEQFEGMTEMWVERGAENFKLRELARLLLWGIDNDMPRYEKLAWTQKVNALVRELGVDE